MNKDNKKREVWAVDLDARLALYEEGDLDKFGPEHIGESIPEMVAKINNDEE
jgi:hypothetical protein